MGICGGKPEETVGGGGSGGGGGGGGGAAPLAGLGPGSLVTAMQMGRAAGGTNAKPGCLVSGGGISPVTLCVPKPAQPSASTPYSNVIAPSPITQKRVACHCSKAIVALMSNLARRRVICGDGAVGKTCVLNRHMNDDFSDGYEPTIFEDWAGEAELGNYGLQACKVTLRDTAGQEAFDAINKASFMNVDAFMIAFSVNSDRFDTSLDNVGAKVRLRRRCPFAIASLCRVYLCALWHKLGLSGGCPPAGLTGAAGGLSGFRWSRKPRRRPGFCWWGRKRTGTPWTGPVRVRRPGGR